MNIMLFLKGIVVGIAKVIPGLSGAIFMISFNLYDRAVNAVVDFFSDVKNNTLFLVVFGSGVLVGVVIFSNVISYLVNNYYIFIMSLFIGLIMGGINEIRDKCGRGKVNYLLVIISFVFMISISFFNVDSKYIVNNNFIDYIVFFFGGLLEAMGTIVPGVSSTALLMIMGIYNYYVGILANLFNYSFIIANFYLIISFGLGLFIGVIIFLIVINYMFKNYKSYSFSFIMGVCLASILLLFFKVIMYINNIYSFVLCLLLMFIGYFIGRIK